MLWPGRSGARKWRSPAVKQTHWSANLRKKKWHNSRETKINAKTVHGTIRCLQPSGHYMYRQFNIHISTFCPHSVFMCFVWIWEQTAIISLYSINWLVFITETECLLRGTFYILRSVHTVYLCVLCGSEKKQLLFHCTALTGWFL